MTNAFSKGIWLILPAGLLAAGCAQQQTKDLVPGVPLDDPGFVVAEYASKAIQATGTRRLWAKTAKISADCVVTFYLPDGSYYLTEQYHEICPWLNSIKISAREPQGEFTWQLADGVFSVLEEAEAVDALPIKMYGRDFAEAALDAVTAPARLLDERFQFEVVGDPVKIEGRSYNVIARSNRGMNEPDTRPPPAVIIFYQAVESSLVDALWLADTVRREYLLVRSYDYRQFKKGSVRVPAKVEIFKSNARGELQDRLVEIDYY